MKLYKICGWMLAACLMVSCSDDETVESTSVEEGLPATVTLSIGVPNLSEVDITRASDEQETAIEDLLLLFYKGDSTTPVYATYTLSNPTTVTDTNYTYTIEVELDDLTSGTWYLYAIGNYSKAFCGYHTVSELTDMTKSEMDEFCTTGSTDLDFVGTGVLMTGKYNGEDGDGSTGLLTLQAGENTLQASSSNKNGAAISLRRLIAKNIFNFTASEGITFTATSYSLYNYSNSSTMMERTGWSGTNGTEPGDLTYANSGCTASLNKKEGISISDNSFFFYTQENAQATVSTCTTYAMREAHKDEGTNGVQEFTNAPTNSTYVVVTGTYKDANYTGTVSYTIHLGDFSTTGGSYGNFTVRRNCKYTYNVTVAGVNSIITEAQAKNFEETQPGAEGTITANNNSYTSVRVDAHYEQVLLPISKTSVDRISDYQLYIKTPYNSGTTYTSSTIDNASDYDWIMFGKPATSSTFKSYSDCYGNLLNIKDLLANWAKGVDSSSDYYLVDGDSVYVTAYINEYYYDDKTSDLSTFINVDDREMLLSKTLHISQDGKSIYSEEPIFDLTQRSIKTFCDLSVDNPFGLETVEETPQATFNSSNTQESDTQTNSSSNGWQNWVSDLSSVIGQSWSTYVNESTNGYINGEITSSSVMTTTGNYSLYQCLSRNRDRDGDGLIDEDEIRWYLPSHDQCLDIWFGENSLPTETQLVTADGTTAILYLTSTDGMSRTWWADEGTAFGKWKMGDNSGKNMVRAVRSLKTYNGDPSTVASCTNRVITITGLADECLRTSYFTGNYAAHSTGAEADKLPRYFKIASNNYVTRNTTTTYTANEATTSTSIGSDYYEESDKSDAGLWRVPNEKEFALMYMFDSSDVSTFTIARTTYTDLSSGDTRYYYLQSGGFITTSTDNMTSTSNAVIRLVRDLTDDEQAALSGSSSSGTVSYDSSYAKGGTAFGFE